MLCELASRTSTLEFWKLTLRTPHGKKLKTPLSLCLSLCTFYFQLLKTEVAAPLPIPCHPSDMSHGYVPIKVSEHFPSVS